METNEEDVKPNPAWKIALVAMPTFLILSTAVSMWVWWKRGKNDELDPRLALAAANVNQVELRDHMRKLTELIGERNWESKGGRQNLRRTVAFIDGTLGPQNYGFSVRRERQETLEGELWPVLSANLVGTGKEKELVFAVTAYDAAPVPIALALAAANDLRDEKLTRTVRFVFLPAALTDDSVPVPALLGAGESAFELLEVEGRLDPGLPASPDGRELEEAARAVVDELRRLANRS